MKALPLVMILVAAPALASARAQNAPPRPQQQKPNGFRAEFAASLEEVERKLLELAASTPAEKYAWRPAPDVRSVSEIYMHVVGGNYYLATYLGAEPPKRNGDLEKSVTRKSDVIAELKASFRHLRAAADATADLEKPVKMFGNQTTHRGVLIMTLSHLHEHLGQAIAYARMNGVVPPWSR